MQSTTAQVTLEIEFTPEELKAIRRATLVTNIYKLIKDNCETNNSDTILHIFDAALPYVMENYDRKEVSIEDQFKWLKDSNLISSELLATIFSP